MRGIRMAFIALAGAAVVGCAPTGAPVPPSAPPSVPSTPDAPASPAPDPAGAWRVTGEATTLARGLAAPWSVVPLAGGGALVSERGTGAILELAPDGRLRELAVIDDVVARGESGLHGLAVAEDGGERWLFAYYGTATDNRVVRMPLTGASGELAVGAADVVFDGIPRADTHNGGRLAVGPDGHLYIATGDAQDRGAAQDPASLAGKILRVTLDGVPAPGNPFDSAAWSLGHRNVQGLAWTRDGTLWASEFGQRTWDELNRIEPGGNYGWPVVEGIGANADFIDPVAVWSPSEASPSGIAAVGDSVFVAGLRGERLWAVETADSEPVVAFDGQGRLRDVAAAADGSLWVLTNNTDGRGSPRPEDDLLLRLTLVPSE